MQERYDEVIETDSPQQALYLMTKAFRIRNNYALNALTHFDQDMRHVVVFHTDEKNDRTNHFYHQLTQDLPEKLTQMTEHVDIKNTLDDISDLIKDVDIVYTDKAYLKEDKHRFNQLKTMCEKHHTGLVTVENNVFVPVVIASDKEEYAARTIRPKINQKLQDFKDTVLMEYDGCLGEREAYEVLESFVRHKLDHYDQRNDPAKEMTSGLSPYLKFGFISPVQIFHIINEQSSPNKDAFLEELIVRRELAYNFVYYNEGYDTFDQMTYGWAYQTMDNHILDKREHLYTIEDYKTFNTHDKYFNTAMKEMIYFGEMHGYMRMYWAKKIIEWSKNYEYAFNTALKLNNYYFYDGNTPNGYTGVAWCFGKHDRAWTERQIFGKLRYMNANGLKRKFDIDDYVDMINQRVEDMDE
ncbi:MAG: deoxyribodipyrimidine photo-lyase [Candidatus Izemoplasma sp.]|nr:deoxyribodipyrimidine photo-lyase [Candidatus Izemoplasma sp.]